MARKKHAEHVNHERWLVSYADLLTLLFAFFVVLFASSTKDKNKAQRMAQAMQVAFQQHGFFDPHARTPPLAPRAGASQGRPAPIEITMQQDPSAIARQRLEQRALEASIAPAVRQHLVIMRNSEEGLTLSLNDAGFFDSGSAEVRPETLPILARIAAALPARKLRIEGHTDNLPIHNSRFPSNWELSGARASAIAKVLLERSHTPAADFSIAGFSEYHPIASNATEAGRALNRRVDIVLLGTHASSPATSTNDALPALARASALATLSAPAPSQ